MQPGKLDRRITIQHKTTTRNSVGGFVDSWSDYASRWAAHRQLTAKQAISGNEVDAMFYGEGDTVFIIRFDAQVSSDMRIQYDGNVYAVESVREINGTGRQAFMEIVCNRKN